MMPTSFHEFFAEIFLDVIGIAGEVEEEFLVSLHEVDSDTGIAFKKGFCHCGLTDFADLVLVMLDLYMLTCVILVQQTDDFRIIRHGAPPGIGIMDYNAYPLLSRWGRTVNGKWQLVLIFVQNLI